MTRVTKEFLSNLRVQIQTALDQVAKKEGLASLKIGNIRFSEVGFTSPLECQFKEGESKSLEILRANARMLGFKPEIANAEISYGGKNFRVSGMKRTYIELICLETGKGYKAKADSVLAALVLQKSPLVY